MGGIVSDTLDHLTDPFGLTSDILNETGLAGVIDDIGLTPVTSALGIDTPESIESFNVNPALTPNPLEVPTALPEPEAPVARRQRAARSNRSRRGRASTIMTAFNNEPLGGR